MFITDFDAWILESRLNAIDAVRRQLALDGYVECGGDSMNESFVMSCLHSSNCPGPTFLHLFLRGLELKVITMCASCGGMRVLSTVEMDPPDVAA